MRWFAFSVALLIVIIGLIGMIDPGVLSNVASFALTQAGIYGAALLRIIFGVILIRAARDSRLPRTVRVMGVIILIAGITTPFIGLERARTAVDWWTSRGPLALRAWAALAMFLGVFIMYAITPRRLSA